MKTLKIITALILTTIFVSCSTQKAIVESDKNLNTDFSKFQTYYWATNAAEDGSLLYVLNNAILKTRIRDAIQYEMDARGYTIDPNNPDLLVNFRVLEEPTKFTGYTGVYKDENYWGPMEMRKNAIGLVPEAEVRTADNKKTYMLDKGSLIIDLASTEDYQVVWQGYASGILQDGNVFDLSEDKIRDAVQAIYTEYEYRADQTTTTSSID